MRFCKRVLLSAGSYFVMVKNMNTHSSHQHQCQKENGEGNMYFIFLHFVISITNGMVLEG